MRKLILSIICFTLFFAFSCPVFAESRVSVTASELQLTGAFDFIKDIFVPKDNYFNNQIAKLNDNVNRKLGGIAYLYHMIEYFFKTLNSPPAQSDFTFSIPDNFVYDGFKGTSNDMLLFAKPFIRIIKAVTTAFLVIITAIACYRKLVTFFEK